MVDNTCDGGGFSDIGGGPSSGEGGPSSGEGGCRDGGDMCYRVKSGLAVWCPFVVAALLLVAGIFFVFFTAVWETGCILVFLSVLFCMVGCVFFYRRRQLQRDQPIVVTSSAPQPGPMGQIIMMQPVTVAGGVPNPTGPPQPYPGYPQAMLTGYPPSGQPPYPPAGAPPPTGTPPPGQPPYPPASAPPPTGHPPYAALPGQGTSAIPRPPSYHGVTDREEEKN
uniref:Uncharacterized protein n=1 Tax=Branchiostoma floridae TaxID=7739 RepID=C3ZH28_BRAFL|eukprot:XP_002592164.1 hypothetical protein BRAFLDRAFT_88113 [Branchiostoma floridae]